MTPRRARPGRARPRRPCRRPGAARSPPGCAPPPRGSPRGRGSTRPCRPCWAPCRPPPFKPVVRVPLQGGAVASKDPYLALNYTIDEEAGTFEIEVETNYTGGWVGVAFPETPCAMVPADAVIAEFGEDDEIVVGTFRLEDVLVSGTKPDPKQNLAGSSAGRTGDTLRMTFS